jgi:hypothetical protein
MFEAMTSYRKARVGMDFYTKAPGGMFDTGDLNMQHMVDAFYQRNIDGNQSWWQEADLDTRTEVGDFDYFFDAFNIPVNRRRQFSFNITRPVVNVVEGFQRDNRKSIIAIPVENADQITADQITKVLSWLDRDISLSDTISTAFHGALVTGMGMMHVWIDYRNDPINGDLKVDYRHYNSILMDTYFKNPDMSDADGILTRSFVTRSELISMYPDKEELINSVHNRGADDGRFQYMPQTYRYDRAYLLAYDEFYYRAYRKQKLLIDTKTNLSYEWKNGSDKDMKDFVKQFPQLTIRETMVPTVRLATLVNGKVIFDGASPLGTDDYPMIPVFAYFNPQNMYWQWRVCGMVRGARDAQWLYNRRKVIELDIAESQITTGWIYKENALVNPLDIYQLQGQGKGLAIRHDAQMTDVQQIRPGSIDPSFFQLSDNLKNDVRLITGVNEELLGSGEDDIPGIRSMLKQGAGLRTLKPLFDKLDLAQKILGRVLMRAIQVNYSPEKIRKIIQEEPTQEFHNQVFGRYDIAIEDGFNTTTQKQMQFAQALELRQMGVQITDEDLLDMATMQNKDRIIKRMQEQKQQAAQMQQQQMEIQMQQAQAQLRGINAKATADEGLGVERMSRVQENEQLAVERNAKAVQDQAQAKLTNEQAVLTIAKAMKELESIDYANFEKFISLMHMYKRFEAGESQSPHEEIAQPIKENSSTT